MIADPIKNDIEDFIEALESPEVIVDNENVCVPNERYEELMRAKVTLEIIGKTYRKLDSYMFEAFMGVLFPKLPSADETAEDK